MLSQYRSQQLQGVLDIIIKAASPDKVFLWGVAENCRTEVSIFNAEPELHQQVSHYYLVILTRVNDKRCFDALQDVMESRCRHSTPITVFIEGVHVFNQWINTGHPFACRVVTHGLLAYDAGAVELSKPGDGCEPDTAQQVKEFARCDKQVTEFLAGTELYLLRKQFGLSAFLLHQAAEHSCTILLKMMTGYRAATHNLDKLFRFCQPFSAQLARLFPRNNERENYLFNLLQKAYVHGRYRDDYVITEKELRLLAARVRHLQGLGREMAKRKFSGQLACN
jgi:HEPN domain-containing protein